MNGVNGIFAEMRKSRIESVNEEKQAKANQGSLNEETSGRIGCSDKRLSKSRHRKSSVNEEFHEECEAKRRVRRGARRMNETEGLDINRKATNGKAFTVEINGKKYSYYPTEESGLTAKELGQKYGKIAQYSKGKALAWLKKNATTPDSYRKAANEEEELDEEITLDIDAEDILKAATAIEKAESEGKTAKVTLSVDGFKIEEIEDEEPEVDDEEPEETAEEECSGEKENEEKCPKCGRTLKDGEKCCEGKVDEEVDVAELAARLDECEGSEYMKKALEQGKYDMVKKYLYLRED